jgi:nitrous oxide reductase accessory protein NosL
MNNTNKTGGPAFPIASDAIGHCAGMELRDYFAAKAMQAIVSNGDVDPQKISQASYIIADAMLKAREA